MCNENKCLSNFKSLDKFRRHLNKYHKLPLAVTKNSINTSNQGYILNSRDNVCNEIDSEKIVTDKSFKVLPENDIYEHDSFEDEIEKSILNFLTGLYKNCNISNKLMQTIVENTNELISDGILPKLKRMIMPFLDSCNNDEKLKINKIFDILKRQFLQFDNLRLSFNACNILRKKNCILNLKP